MIRWFNDLKLREKFLLIIVFLAAAILVSEALSRSITNKAYDEQLYTKTVQILSTYSDRMEIEFKKMETVTFSIIGDPAMQDYLIIMRDNRIGSDSWIEARTKAGSIVDNYYFNSSFFKNLWILTDNGDIGKLSSAAAFSTRGRTESIEKAKEAQGSMRLLPSKDGLTIVREIRQIKFLELSNLGIIVTDIDFTALAESCGQSFARAGIALDVDIFSAEHLLYSSTRKDAAPRYTTDGWRVEDGRFIVCYTSANLDLNFVVSVPYDEIYTSIREANRVSATLAVALTLVAISLCFILVSNISRGLTVLVARMDDFKRGVPQDERSFSHYSSRKEEIGKLHRHFTEMTDDYHALMQKHFESQILLKESMLLQLQQQIQPHFLFNTLSTISWMAYANRDEEVAHITESLSRILRASLDSSERIVTVKEELVIIENYLFIQKTRFHDKLMFDIDIEESVLSTPIPPLTLQPVIENAISHGLEEILEPCTIKIYSAVRGDSTEIIIANNGPPIDEDVLSKIERGEIKGKGMGIGLSNIDKRIKLAFSEDYGLSFANENGFVKVIIHLPRGAVEEETEC